MGDVLAKTRSPIGEKSSGGGYLHPINTKLGTLTQEILPDLPYQFGSERTRGWEVATSAAHHSVGAAFHLVWAACMCAWATTCHRPTLRLHLAPVFVWARRAARALGWVPALSAGRPRSRLGARALGWVPALSAGCLRSRLSARALGWAPAPPAERSRRRRGARALGWVPALPAGLDQGRAAREHALHQRTVAGCGATVAYPATPTATRAEPAPWSAERSLWTCCLLTIYSASGYGPTQPDSQQRPSRGILRGCRARCKVGVAQPTAGGQGEGQAGRRRRQGGQAARARGRQCGSRQRGRQSGQAVWRAAWRAA
jgi:hypothetical protein